MNWSEFALISSNQKFENLNNIIQNSSQINYTITKIIWEMPPDKALECIDTTLLLLGAQLKIYSAKFQCVLQYIYVILHECMGMRINVFYDIYK